MKKKRVLLILSLYLSIVLCRYFWYLRETSYFLAQTNDNIVQGLMFIFFGAFFLAFIRTIIELVTVVKEKQHKRMLALLVCLVLAAGLMAGTHGMIKSGYISDVTVVSVDSKKREIIVTGRGCEDGIVLIVSNTDAEIIEPGDKFSNIKYVYTDLHLVNQMRYYASYII